jgi:hypothetical protein
LRPILVLHSNSDRLSIGRKCHMAKRQRLHTGGELMALDDLAGVWIQLDDGAFNIAGVDRRSLDVGGLGNAPDCDHQPLAAAGE